MLKIKHSNCYLCNGGKSYGIKFELYSTIYDTCCEIDLYVLGVHEKNSGFFDVMVSNFKNIENTLDFSIYAFERIFKALGYSDREYATKMHMAYPFDVTNGVTGYSDKLNHWQSEPTLSVLKKLDALLEDNLNNIEEENIPNTFSSFIKKNTNKCLDIYINHLYDSKPDMFDTQFMNIFNYYIEKEQKWEKEKILCSMFLYYKSKLNDLLKDKAAFESVCKQYFKEKLSEKEILDIIFSDTKTLETIYLDTLALDHAKKKMESKLNSISLKLDDLMVNLDNFKELAETKENIDATDSMLDIHKIDDIYEKAKNLYKKVFELKLYAR